MKYRICKLLTTEPWFLLAFSGWPKPETMNRWAVLLEDNGKCVRSLGSCGSFEEARLAVSAVVSAKPGELVMLPNWWRRK